MTITFNTVKTDIWNNTLGEEFIEPLDQKKKSKIKVHMRFLLSNVFDS